jgi:hypothetical protein
MLDYIGSRREMEEWTSDSLGSPWNTTKLLGSHVTTEQINRRQEQEFMMTMKWVVLMIWERERKN